MSYIYHNLDLVVRLTDATTGRFIDRKQIRFLGDGNEIPLIEKGRGIYVLLDRRRDNMMLEVRAQGFLTVREPVDYSALDNRYPQMEISMIPEVKPYGYTDLITLEGHMPGIESIAAAPLHEPCAVISGYQEKKQILRFLSSKRLEEESYALLHEEKGEFEEIWIGRSIGRLAVKLKKPLEQSCSLEEKVVRMIRGRTDAFGGYLLRIRENGEKAEYLIRYRVRGRMIFQKINFKDAEDRRLK